MYENKCLQYWSGVPTVNVHCRYRLLLPVASTCSSIANSVEQTAMPGATAIFQTLRDEGRKTEITVGNVGDEDSGP